MKILLFSRRQPRSEFHQRLIGISSPGSPNANSYLITGTEGKGAEVQILNTFLKHKARIISQSSYVDEASGEFTMSLVCDLTKADSSPDDFLVYLCDIKSVKDVQAAKMKNRLFEGFLFPLALVDNDRVIALKSNFSFQLQDHLEPQTAKSIVTRLGRSYALDVVSEVKSKFLESTSEEVIKENVIGYLRSAGWGTFSWKTEGEIEQVVLQDPPTSKSGEARGNLLVVGIAEALVNYFLKKNMSVMNAYYNAETRSLSMILAEPRPASEHPQGKKEEGDRVVEEKPSVLASERENDGPEASVGTQRVEKTVVASEQKNYQLLFGDDELRSEEVV